MQYAKHSNDNADLITYANEAILKARKQIDTLAQVCLKSLRSRLAFRSGTEHDYAGFMNCSPSSRAELAVVFQVGNQNRWQLGKWHRSWR